MEDQIRICLICDGYPPDRKMGGIEYFTQMLARGLVERGHYVSVIGYSDNLKQRTIEDDQGVRVIYLPRHSKRIIPRMITERFALETEIRHEIHESRIQLLEIPDVRGMLLFDHFGIPIIARMHGANFSYFGSTGRKVSLISSFFEKRTLKLADHIVSVSNYIKRETLKRVANVSKKCTTIYNGVDAEKMFVPDPTISQEEGLILFVGRLSITKGAPNLFKALPIIFTKFRNSRLRFIGQDFIGEDGRLVSEKLIESIAGEYKSRIEINGEFPREKLPKEYQKASVVVFPSLVEANPIAVLESMACASPTVFMNSGPGPEMIEHGIEGLLCNTKDYVDIAEKVIFMLKNPDQAKEMGRAARIRVLKYSSITRFLDENENYYKAILNKH